MSRNTALFAFSSLIALCCASAALAQDAASSETEVIVIGQRNTPITVEPRGLSISLSQAHFDGINALNVEDLMKYTPNFFVRKRFAGDDNAVVALRGANTVQSARTIVMVDGFVVSNFLGNRFDFPPKWNVVGPAEVKQFDIVYGPFSARYNGHSMGGIVNITTRNPKKNELYATAQYMVMPFKEYGFDETFVGYSLEAGLTYLVPNSGLSLRGSYRHFDNIGQSMSYTNLTTTTGTGVTVTGAYDDPWQATPVFGAASPPHVTQDQLRFRAGYDFGNGWQADALAMIWQNKQTLTDARVWIKDASGNPITTNQKVVFGGKTYSVTTPTYSISERTEYLTGFKLSGPIGDGRLRANLSRYWIGKSTNLASSTFATGMANGAGTSTIQNTPGWWTFDGEYEIEAGRQAFAIGLNANLYETDQDVFSTTAWREQSGAVRTGSFAGKTTLWGVFAEDEMTFDWGSMTLGLRYDAWRAFDGAIGKKHASNATFNVAKLPSRHGDAISPKFSIQTKGWFDTDVQLSLGTATRFPTVGELYQGKVLDTTGDVDPLSFDPNLKPERSKDLNLIVRKNVGSANLVASYFYQDITDAIFSYPVFVGSTTVTRYENIDLVRQYGLELVAEARNFANITGLDVDASVTRIKATTVKNSANPASEGVNFPRIPDWRVSGNVRYAISPKLKASLGWRYATRPNSDLFGLVRGDSFGYQSEYFLIDTRLSYDVNENLQVSLGVDNINNDQAYVAHPLPQRTFMFEVKYKR